MANTNLNIRTDKQLKKQAEKVFSSLGLNMTTAINMFLRASVRQRGIPFELKVDPDIIEPVEIEAPVKAARKAAEKAEEEVKEKAPRKKAASSKKTAEKKETAEPKKTSGRKKTAISSISDIDALIDSLGD